jgi:hypothetical protein
MNTTLKEEANQRPTFPNEKKSPDDYDELIFNNNIFKFLLSFARSSHDSGESARETDSTQTHL